MLRKNIVAVIPARGGSKRIPKKNIRNFNGQPIITRVIEIVRKTKLFSRIIVSTDDRKIAAIAKKYKAEVPFIRPSKLADDKTSANEVVAHTIEWLNSQGQHPKEVCCIYGTAAFIRSKDIINAYKKFKTGKWNFVFSATTFPSAIDRSFYKMRSGGIKMFFPRKYSRRTQDLKISYHDVGQFYWGKIEAWLKQKPVFSKTSAIVDIPRWRAHDIDTIEDWKYAELIHKIL